MIYLNHKKETEMIEIEITIKRQKKYEENIYGL